MILAQRRFLWPLGGWIVLGLMLVNTEVNAQNGDAPTAHIEILSISPRAIAAEPDDVFDEVAPGLNVGAVGRKFYLLAVADEDSTAVDYQWNLASRPEGSLAALSSTQGELVTLRPDGVGSYRVTLTPLDGAGQPGEVQSQTLHAATYVGAGAINTHEEPSPIVPNCATGFCHGGNNADERLAILPQWIQSTHANKLQNHLNGNRGAFYSTSCLECHTVGFDPTPAAENGGFDDVARQIGFDLEQIPAWVAEAHAGRQAQAPPGPTEASATDLLEIITVTDPYEQWAQFPDAPGTISAFDPHGPFAEIFINQAVEVSLADFTGALGAGSIIVKKSMDSGGAESGDAITVMWKVEGFDPEKNDWFWANFSFAGQILDEGAITSCISCHTGVQFNDFVFSQLLSAAGSSVALGTDSSTYRPVSGADAPAKSAVDESAFVPAGATADSKDSLFHGAAFTPSGAEPFIGNFVLLPAELQNLASVQCESCHGPGSLHPLRLTEQDVAIAGVDLSQKQCAQCHDSASGFQQKFYQWSSSSHPLTTNAAEGRVTEVASCVRCHTGEGFVDVQIDLLEPTIIPAPNAITCPTCHDPHFSPFDHQLRIAGDYTFASGQTFPNPGKGGLCMRCHNSRVADVEQTVQTSRRGAHHGPQADMLLGINGSDLGLTFDPNSAHTTGVEDTCVQCHMAESPEEGIAPDLAATVGEHSYAMRDHGVAEDPNDDLINAANACAICHTGLDTYDRLARGDYDGDGAVEGIQTEVTGLFDLLRSRILTSMPGAEVSAESGKIELGSADFDALSPLQRESLYNYNFVWEDGSLGVHNTSYAVQLLQRSYFGVFERSISSDFPQIELRGPERVNDALAWRRYE